MADVREAEVFGLVLWYPENPYYDSDLARVLVLADELGVNVDVMHSRLALMFPRYCEEGRLETRSVVRGKEGIISYIEGMFNYQVHKFVNSCVEEFGLPNGRNSI